MTFLEFCELTDKISPSCSITKDEKGVYSIYTNLVLVKGKDGMFLMERDENWGLECQSCHHYVGDKGCGLVMHKDRKNPNECPDWWEACCMTCNDTACSMNGTRWPVTDCSNNSQEGA